MARPVKARVLVDVTIAGILYQSGKHVVEVDGDLAKQYVKDGALDTDPAAVKYALSEEGGAKLVVHAPVVEAKAEPLVAEIEALAAAVKAAADPDQAAALQAQLDAKQAELAQK